MTLSALIRKRDAGNLATAIPAISATQPTREAATVARIATVAVANPREDKTAPPAIVDAGETATVSRSWLIHYPDREPVEVACCPEATHADVLERHPDAVAAEPIPPKPEPVPSCNACQHRPPRHRNGDSAPCGNPVAAGLSDLPGVIRYSPNDGKTCKTWRACLDTNLERRILEMAERWRYSGDELALAQGLARKDPDGWLREVSDDEHTGITAGELDRCARARDMR